MHNPFVRFEAQCDVGDLLMQVSMDKVKRTPLSEYEWLVVVTQEDSDKDGSIESEHSDTTSYSYRSRKEAWQHYQRLVAAMHVIADARLAAMPEVRPGIAKASPGKRTRRS